MLQSKDAPTVTVSKKKRDHGSDTFQRPTDSRLTTPAHVKSDIHLIAKETAEV